jgi:hypothetical protein
MLQTDRSVAIPTGMIIAALYVVMLVGFSRESYMRRDAESLESAAAAPPAASVSMRLCRIEQRLCGVTAAIPDVRQSCPASLATLRQLDGSAAPLTLPELRQFLGAEP